MAILETTSPAEPASGPPPGRRARSRGPVRAAAVVLAVVLGGLALAWLVSPYHSDFGGGDPENYLFNGIRQVRGDEAAYRFLPPEWEALPAEDRDALRAALLDDEARMYRLADLPPGAEEATPTVAAAIARKKAVVDEANQIEIAHDNLYSVALSVAALVYQDEAPYLLNSLLVVAAGVLFASLAQQLTGSRWAWTAGVLLVLLPATLDGARETRTEAFATLLVVAFAWLTVRDHGRSAWPGLVLVALWMTRHEFVVPLLVYLVWAALRRRPGTAGLTLAAVASAYLFPWGPAAPGDLFPGDRDFFAALPDVGAWALLPLVGVVWALAAPMAGRVEVASATLTAWGRRPGLHRAAWGGLVAVAVVAEGLRRTLEVGEPGFMVLRGAALSTLDVLVDTAGWPIVALGLGGLLVLGPRLAGRAPWVLALVMAPQAMVLLRTGTSGDDIWNVARRFQTALYLILLIGVALVVVEVVRRAPRPVVGQAGAVALTAVAAFGLLGPFDRLPADGHEADRGDARSFHAAAAELPEDALVILDPTYGSMSAQPTLRIFGGRWSVVAWDDDELAEVLPLALGTAERPVVVEESLVELVTACGAEVADAGWDLPVEHGLSDGEVVRLRLVDDPASCTP